MDFNTTIDIILKDLREVREIIDDLKNYPGIPPLQVELAKSKCKSAEDVIALLKSLKSFGSEKKTETMEMPGSEKSTEKPLVNSIFEREQENKAQIKSHPEIPADKTYEQNNEGKSNQSAPSIKSKKADPTIIAETFAAKPETLFDQFGNSKKDDDIASVIKSKVVENLSDAIGINDKFLFIREIFSGSQSSYEEAISKLNSAGNLADARAIIMNYSRETEENDVVKQLLEIVKRKLPSDG